MLPASAQPEPPCVGIVHHTQTRTAPLKAVWPGGAAQLQGMKSSGVAVRSPARRGTGNRLCCRPLRALHTTRKPKRPPQRAAWPAGAANLQEEQQGDFWNTGPLPASDSLRRGRPGAAGQNTGGLTGHLKRIWAATAPNAAARQTGGDGKNGLLPCRGGVLACAGHKKPGRAFLHFPAML